MYVYNTATFVIIFLARFMLLLDGLDQILKSVFLTLEKRHGCHVQTQWSGLVRGKPMTFQKQSFFAYHVVLIPYFIMNVGPIECAHVHFVPILKA